jgi:formylglycine-generating enzyme required for sulfatase activity
MKTAINIILNIILALTLTLFVTGCGDSSTSTSDSGTGSIAAKLVWDADKDVAKSVASAPSGVTTVRFIISGSGMSTIQQDFAASAGTGVIGGVLAGSGRTFMAQGLNSSGAVTHQGSKSGITVQAGQTYEAGAIVMTALAAAPAMPTGLKATAISSSQINLSWTDITGETGYKIERKTGTSGTYAQIAAPVANVTTYSDTSSLAAGTTCFYQIRATNSAGDSAYANAVSVMTTEMATGLAAPTFLVATAVSSSQINLSWQDKSDNETAFKIERKIGSNGTYALLNTTPENVPSYSDTGLTTGVTYYYRVQAFSSGILDTGYISLGVVSSYSNEASATPSNASGGATITDPITGMVLVTIPGGTFTMGDTFGDGYGDEKPTHQVTVSSFSIGKYEVTQGQWQAVMGSNPSYFSSCGSTCPVENVSWNDIQTFITKLNQQSGKKYRLPTEAEWEYAARSGAQDQKYSGTNDVNVLGNYAWYWDNSNSTTHLVGQKQANSFGLYDMSGNVWEWVNDWYSSTYYTSAAQTNPTGPTTGSYRVFRGGSWYFDAYFVRASSRGSGGPDARSYIIGFRVAL